MPMRPLCSTLPSGGKGVVAISQRTLTTSPSHRASTSILFALSSLSNSRETQHFNKISRLPRTEHSPPLKLIENSEVKPHPLPSPPPVRSQRPVAFRSGRQRTATTFHDDRALKAGKAVLAAHAAETRRLQKRVERARQHAVEASEANDHMQESWKYEKDLLDIKVKKLRSDLRVAGLWIVAAVGTTTGLAVWRFAPEKAAVDSAELGNKIAAKARETMTFSTAISGGKGARVEGPKPAVVRAMETAPKPLTTLAPQPQTVSTLASSRPSSPTPSASSSGERSWYEGLFWKQP